MGFVDHGQGGTGEPVAALLRPGNAGSNTATDHIIATQPALAQLPKKYRRGRRTLIRTDSAGGTHDFLAWLAQRGRWLSYSVGMTVTEQIHQHVLKVPASAWTPAVETDGEIRDGAWVAELTGDVQNRIWMEIVQIALDLLAWMPMLALTGKARLWEPRRLRLRPFTAAGQLVTTGRRRILRLARHWPRTSHITAALDQLARLPNPA